MSELLNAIEDEIRTSDKLASKDEYASAFYHLERAHVLGQSITLVHARVHWRMLKLGINLRSVREFFGQLLRIVGASTKTPLGVYPKGNTGGSDVWFFKPMPVPRDLEEVIGNG